MASVGDVFTALEKFELDLIEKQWAEDIWTSEFTSCPDDLPDEFFEKFSPLSYCDISQVIDQADKVINLWLNECSDTASDSESTSSSIVGPSWTLLQEFDYKTLLSLLYYYICKGQIHNQDATAVHTCIKATNFYFTLLMIPGSNVYKVFHTTLFEKSLETFSLHKYLEIATRTKVKKVKQTNRNDQHDSDDEYLEMDETLTLSQQQNVVKQLNFLLTTFQELVNKFSFKKYSEALNMSLNILAELSRIERNSTLQEFSTNSNSSSFAPLSRNAYITMKAFCSNKHGSVSEIIRLVLYYIMPNLTLIGGPAIPEMAKWNNKELSNIRSIAVSFVTENIITMGEDAHKGLEILLQQICFNMIDRADYRTKAAEMVLTIMSKLPMGLYYSVIMWIFRLSMMEGVHHRIIGLEMLSKLIYLKPGTVEKSKFNDTLGQNTHADSHLGMSQSVDQNRSDTITNRTDTLQNTDLTASTTNERIVSFTHTPVNYVPLEFRRAMLAIIVDRIRDEAATVRTRALMILSELISAKSSPTVLHLMQDIFVKPYLNMSSICNITNSNENDFLKWKTFVASLDKVRDPSVNKVIIPGGRVIMNKVFEKCLDERVNVRRAALQVISKIFKFCPKWMTDENLELFGSHCRDPALSIRKEMVGSVMELMLYFPDHDPLLKLWVEEVVPQITDREIRVQEQVLQILTQGIISKITTYDKMRTPMDMLPWKLIKRIAELKMRSFLVTACSLWTKANQINQNLIKMIKTHVATENNNQAWVLLASLSEYVDIEQPDFVMNYYMEVVSQGVIEPAISHLVLITLNNCWHRLKKENQEIIQNDMYNRLKTYSVHPTLIGLTVDIATGITVRLAEDELDGKQEVAKYALEMIQDVEAHLENCLKSGKSANYNCQDCMPILCLLGCLSAISPEKIKHQTFLLLYNYLMNSKNETKEYDRKMRAIAVIALAKMALRCDSFARNLVAGLSQLLSTSSDPVLLNNVIVAISDIGERYANLIEPLISSICVCLQSKHKSLREMTLILLIELLQEDYLKARGALVYHLLTLVNDPNPRAVNIVKYYFTNCLIARHPYKMYQLLLPGLFHLNNYTSHPDYPRLEMTDAEWRAFDLSGPEKQKHRMNIYQFMLSNVPDMVKMKCLHFICTVVLNGVADNIICIKHRNGEQLLSDALQILLMKEIKIEYGELVKKKNEDGEEEEDQKQNPIYKLGKQMFSAVHKKEIIETIVPICCKLKKKLVAEKKKLLCLLYKFVRDLVKEYKDEMTEIFKEDKQFGKEILYEIENMANMEEESDNEEDELPLRETEGGDEHAAVNGEGVPDGQGVPEEHVAVNGQDVPVVDAMETHIASAVQEITGRKTRPVVQLERISEEIVAQVNKGQKVVNANDLDAIEDYDPNKHAPARRRSSAAEWRMNSLSSGTPDDVPKHFDVRVQIERLSLDTINKTNSEAEVSLPVVTVEKPSENIQESTVTQRNHIPLKEAVLSLQKLTPKNIEELQKEYGKSNRKSKRAKSDDVVVRDLRPRRGSSAGEYRKKRSSSVLSDNSQLRREIQNESEYPIRELRVSLERLSTDALKNIEKSQNASGEKSVIEKLKEDAKRLSVSLERLNPKYLENVTKNKPKKRNEDSEKAIAKGAKGIVMPPPAVQNVKKNKKKISTPKSKKLKQPITPEVEGKTKLLTSTPMIAPGSDKEFEFELSPVVNEDENED